MDYTNNIQRLKEEIYFLSERYGSVAQALKVAKDRNVNLNYMIPNHLWPEIEAEIDWEIQNKYF